jgi:CRP/FNR family cyclic AMP-dependent transcriptional regulator
VRNSGVPPDDCFGLNPGFQIRVRSISSTRIIWERSTLDGYPREQIVFSQGDPADAVFFLKTGKVKITVVSQQGKEAIVAILGANDFFGEGCLAGQKQRIATATTIMELVIVRLEKDAILRVIQEQPAFAELFIAHLLGRTIRVEADLGDQLFKAGRRAKNYSADVGVVWRLSGKC